MPAVLLINLDLFMAKGDSRLLQTLRSTVRKPGRAWAKSSKTISTPHTGICKRMLLNWWGLLLAAVYARDGKMIACSLSRSIPS